MCIKCIMNNADIYISSVYSPVSDFVGLHLHFFFRNVNEGYWSRVLRPGAPPGINHMHGMQYQIILNNALCLELN